MGKSDQRLISFKNLYEKAKMSGKPVPDLENSIIAKIDIDEHNGFPFSDYAQFYTSINILAGKRYQYFIFKSGYSYQKGKFMEIKNGKKKILSTAKAEHIK